MSTSTLVGANDIQVELARRVGLRAKCSYLLSVLADEGISTHERAAATWALVADSDRILSTLPREDLSSLREILDEKILSRTPSWSIQALPSDAISGPDLVDGVNVRRVVVPAATDEPSRVDVARFEPVDDGPFVLSSECTFATSGVARVEAVDGEGRVVGSVPIEPGHARFAAMVVSELTSPGTVTVRIINSSENSVVWYQSTAEQWVDAGDVETLSELVRREMAARQPSTPPAAFVPITTEPVTLSDIDRLMSLRDRFHGERVFIMGNGPSLNRTPLDRLDDEFVFGLNRVSLLFDRVSWRPTFFTAFDVRVVPDNQEEFAALDVPYKFFSARYKPMMGERDNHFWYHTKGHYEGFDHAFEPTVVYSGFGGGGTIGVIAIELAFFMGFREIYLIGTDVSYRVPDTVKQSGADQFGDGVKLELESTQDDDVNHFDPRYFGKGKKWHNPNVREMKIGFARAAAYVDQRGGRVLNATVGGELDEVERVDFESLF